MLKIHKALAILITVLYFAPVYGQSNWQSDLSFYSDVMVNASDPMHRIRAEAEFHKLMKSCLTTHQSGEVDFAQMPWVTVISPADSTFRIITWQVQEEVEYRYGGFIEFRSGSQQPIELVSSRPLKSEYSVFTPETWYGALYYGIQPFRTLDKEDAYILLGFNAYTPALNQRVADVLWFDQGQAFLGAPVFYTSDSTETKSRIIIEYADAAAGTMRFDREKDLLVYDHVIPISTPEGPTLVPDGSFHGYQYKKGRWNFVDMVFNVKVDTPPGGRQKDSVERDLFGRPVPKNN